MYVFMYYSKRLLALGQAAVTYGVNAGDGRSFLPRRLQLMPGSDSRNSPGPSAVFPLNLGCIAFDQSSLLAVASDGVYWAGQATQGWVQTETTAQLDVLATIIKILVTIWPNAAH